MTDTTENTTTVKTKASEVDRLKVLAGKIAKSIVKSPLSEKAAEDVHSVINLLMSTVQHSEMLAEHAKSTDNSVVSEETE